MEDIECLNNARKHCDNDPNCFGVAWYPNKIEQNLKLCTSAVMEPKVDGWRTLMKEGKKFVRKKRIFVRI